MSLLTFTKTEFHNLFSKPATRLYPQEPRVYSERTRGHIENNMDVCILCGLCSKKCPTGAITVDRAGKTWSISRFSCIQCGYCVESCPKKCLSMNQAYTQPGPEKQTDVFKKPETEAAPVSKTETKPASAVAPKPVPKAENKPAPVAEQKPATKAETKQQENDVT